MVKKYTFSEQDIHKIYLEWMNQTDMGSVRKQRFLQTLKNIPIEKQYELERWIVSALAIGLLEGYNTATNERKENVK